MVLVHLAGKGSTKKMECLGMQMSTGTRLYSTISGYWLLTINDDDDDDDDD